MSHYNINSMPLSSYSYCSIRSVSVLFVVFSFYVIQMTAQVSEINGFLQIIPHDDTTSMYIGVDAGRNSLSQEIRHNTVIGTFAGRKIKNAGANTLIGYLSGSLIQNDGGNTFIGMRAGMSNTGSSNTFIGYNAGEYVLGNENIIIGSNAGPTTNNNMFKELYIDVNKTDAPLIYGNFDRDLLQANGTMVIKSQNQTHFPDTELIVEDELDKTPLILLSEGGTDLSNGMSIEYDGTGAGSNNKLHINKTGGNHMVTFKNDGNVGIGTTNPTRTLEVDGGIYLSGFMEVGGNQTVNGQLRLLNLPTNGTTDLRINSSGVLSTSSSDRRLKKDIKPIIGALDIIMALNGVSFVWKADEMAGEQYGLIAQDVMEVVPQVVTQNGLYYGVDYTELTGVLIEAIKSQQRLINQQRTDLTNQEKLTTDLTADINKVLNRLSQLESSVGNKTLKHTE